MAIIKKMYDEVDSELLQELKARDRARAKRMFERYQKKQQNKALSETYKNKKAF